MKVLQFFVLSIALLATGVVSADYQFKTYNYPGAVDTVFLGSSENGAVIGHFYTEPVYIAKTTHSFIKKGRVATEIVAPGSDVTYVQDISNSGTVVGGYLKNGVEHGFILSHGAYTTFDVPNSIQTRITGINSSGDLVGSYRDENGEHGFTSRNGVISSFDIADATILAPGDINDAGLVVGHYFKNDGGNWSTYAFVKDGDAITDIIDPQVTGSSYRDAGGINNANLVVGSYITGAPNYAQFGYIYDYDKSAIKTIFLPGAKAVLLADIDNNNRAVGAYVDQSNGRFRGLILKLKQ